MSTRSTLSFSLALFLLASSTASAQVESGPQAGSDAKPVKAVALIKDEAEKEKDFVADRAGKPTIFLFVQADKFDRPVARFMRTLDQDLVKNRDDVQVVAVWLTDDVDMSKKYVPRARESLKLGQTTYSVFPGEKSGPDGWGINGDAHLTAVIVEKGKVTGSFGYRSVNETDVPAVIKKLKAKK
ncbi:hypothetical protein BH10PLA2_BH10PLA2_33600 [soil metagenome]